MAELTFEQAVVELEEIIKKLEFGKMPLEDAVKAFERGSELKKICEENKIDYVDISKLDKINNKNKMYISDKIINFTNK